MLCSLQLNDVRGGLRRSVGVDELFGDGDLAALAQLFTVPADGLHYGLAAARVCVTNIELQNDTAGHAVDRAGVDIAGSDGGYGVDGSCGEGVSFDRENEFGGGTEGVFAIRHQERSGVASETSDGETVAGRGGDAGDDPDGDAFALE